MAVAELVCATQHELLEALRPCRCRLLRHLRHRAPGLWVWASLPRRRLDAKQHLQHFAHSHFLVAAGATRPSERAELRHGKVKADAVERPLKVREGRHGIVLASK